MRNCPICVLCVSTVVLIYCRYARLITLWLRYGIVIIICRHSYILSEVHHKTFRMKVLLYVFLEFISLFEEKVVTVCKSLFEVGPVNEHIFAFSP